MDVYRKFHNIDFPPEIHAIDLKIEQCRSQIAAINGRILTMSVLLQQKQCELQEKEESMVLPSSILSEELDSMLLGTSKVDIAEIMTELSQLNAGQIEELNKLLSQLSKIQSGQLKVQIAEMTHRALELPGFDVSLICAAVSACKANLVTRHGILRKIAAFLPLNCNLARLSQLLGDLRLRAIDNTENSLEAQIELMTERLEVVELASSIFQAKGTYADVFAQYNSVIAEARHNLVQLKNLKELQDSCNTLRYNASIKAYLLGGPRPNLANAAQDVLFELFCASVDNGERVLYFWHKCGLE